jgi:hypothetical protein
LVLLPLLLARGAALFFRVAMGGKVPRESLVVKTNMRK